MGELEPLTVRRDRPLAVSFAAPTEDMVRHIAIRAAAVALLTAAPLVSAFAAEPYLLPPPVDANVVAEGAPCPGYQRHRNTGSLRLGAGLHPKREIPISLGLRGMSRQARGFRE